VISFSSVVLVSLKNAVWCDTTPHCFPDICMLFM
jgi:hypothetical protein